MKGLVVQLKLPAIVVCAIAVSAIGCSKESPAAVSPTAPTPTLVSLTLSPASGSLTVGQSATIAVTGSFSDGSTRVLTANWTSSNGAVASVNAAGLVTALSGGQTMITASVSGQSVAGIYTVNVSPSGSWLGGLLVTSCTGTGSNSDAFCAPQRGLTQVGTAYQSTLELTENGSSISGVMMLGGVRGPVTGVVVNGVMTLQGTLTQTNGPTLTITHWSTGISGTQMNGFINFEARYSQYAGVAILQTIPVTYTKRE